MKPVTLIKPLTAAIVLAMSAGAWASPIDELLPTDGASAAIVLDSQFNHANDVTNEGTVNDANVDRAILNNSGNVGANVAAGDNNQQANTVSLASADAAFVFAGVGIEQTGLLNNLDNYSNPNTATLQNAINNNSGNVGANVAAGNYNQQKNDMAVAVSSSAQNAISASAVSQSSVGNTTDNNGQLEYANTGTLSVGTVSLSGGYTGTSDQIGDVYLDTWSGPEHNSGQNDSTGHIDVDSAADGAQDLNEDGGAFAFNEQGEIALQGSVTGSFTIVSGFATPVTNTATLTNAVNGNSGNVGVNIAAGGGNQQSNSLAIAAGCQVCN